MELIILSLTVVEAASFF